MFRGLFGPFLEPLIRPILSPITRLLVSLIAIPMFRFFRRGVIRVQDLNEELERDIDQWFRGAILLLIATQNMEPYIFPWAEKMAAWRGEGIIVENWVTFALRLMLAIGVIEKMPDQTLFAIVHPGLRRIQFQKGLSIRANLWQQRKNILLGILCNHINRSSPVFAILCTILPGPLGWTFYGLAITQYLIIGLVTSRDRAKDVLSEFDLRVAEVRRELVDELNLPPDEAAREKEKGPCPDEPASDPPPTGNIREANGAAQTPSEKAMTP